jgi:hypothetical protein
MDFVKLPRLLSSIENFVKDIDGVTIVSDYSNSFKHQIPTDTLKIIKSFDLDVIYEKKPTAIDGYIWQQCVKLNWWKYCDDDLCIQTDSDCFFRRDLCLNDLKLGNRWVWHYRPWGRRGRRPAYWYHSTRKLLRFYPQYQGMVGRTYTFTRDATKDFLTYFTQGLPTDFTGDYILKNKITKLSEYCLFGAYIKKVDHPSYFKKVWVSKKDFLSSPFNSYSAKSRA